VITSMISIQEKICLLHAVELQVNSITQQLKYQLMDSR